MEKILKKFLIAIRGGDYPSLPTDLATEEMILLLENAIARFPYAKQPLWEFDPLTGWAFEPTLTEQKILVGLMVEEWLTSAINGLDLATVEMTTNEIKTFSKTNQIKTIVGWRDNVDEKTQADIALYHKTGSDHKPNLYAWGGDGIEG